MIDNALLSFSFVQGVLAFFAPCAVSLLPGYLSTFLAKQNKRKKVGWLTLVRRSLFFSLATILGIMSIYAVATVLILLFRQIVKSALVYVSMGLAVVIIVVGVLMFFGKSISFMVDTNKLRSDNQVLESYLFGIAYGIGVLGCLFPFFLSVAVSAIQAPSVFAGASYLVAYIVGMSLLMIAFYLVAQFSREFLQTSLKRILPYLNKVGGVLVVLAGLYIIWYQSALL